MTARSDATPPIPLLSVLSIGKVFPGVRALEDVTLEVWAGEVLALVGENGAGKSTLTKILGGILSPDEGEIRIEGLPVEIGTARKAMDLGVSLIHQELNLHDNLNLAENIFLGRHPYRGSSVFQIADRRALHDRASTLLDRVGLQISSHTPLRDLSIGRKQLVEIAKALSMDSRILILDEPTSSLSAPETERLIDVAKNLRESSVGILYVSHRLNEVTELADRVVVLRDGKLAGTLEKNQIERDRIVSLMVGRDIEQYYHHTSHRVREDPALEVENLCFRGGREPIDLLVRKGEIVGLAGLVGAGRTELAAALFGIDPAWEGSIRVNGEEVRIRGPLDAIRAGLFLVPEERKTKGLVLEMSIEANTTMAILPKLSPFGVRNRKVERQLAEEKAKSLSVRSPGVDRRVLNLSGGNQQKVVLAKWLAMQPKVLVLDEPTRGVDVGAKSEIYALISELAAREVGILLISSEMEEIVGISDRAIVMRDGGISGELAGEEITEENVMRLAIEEAP